MVRLYVSGSTLWIVVEILHVWNDEKFASQAAVDESEYGFVEQISSPATPLPVKCENNGSDSPIPSKRTRHSL